MRNEFQEMAQETRTTSDEYNKTTYKLLRDWRYMASALMIATVILYLIPIQSSSFIGMLGSIASTIALVYGVNIYRLSSRDTDQLQKDTDKLREIVTGIQSENIKLQEIVENIKDKNIELNDIVVEIRKENTSLHDKLRTDNEHLHTGVRDISDSLRNVSMDSKSVRSDLLRFLEEVESMPWTPNAKIYIMADILPFGRLILDLEDGPPVSEDPMISKSHNILSRLLERSWGRKAVAILDGYLSPDDSSVWASSALGTYKQKIVSTFNLQNSRYLDSIFAQSRENIDYLIERYHIESCKLQEIPFQAIVVSDETRGATFVLHIGEFNIEGLRKPASISTTNLNIAKTYESVIHSFMETQRDRIVLPHRPEVDNTKLFIWTESSNLRQEYESTIKQYASNNLLDTIVIVDAIDFNYKILCNVFTDNNEAVQIRAVKVMNATKIINDIFREIGSGSLLRLVYDENQGGGIIYGKVLSADDGGPERHLVASVREQHTMDAATARAGQLIDELRAVHGLGPWIRREYTTKR